MFERLESWASAFLERNAVSLPPRWQRWLASYYPDAQLRRLFWLQTKVELGEGTFTNIGMVVADNYRAGESLLSIGDWVSIAPNVTFICESEPNNSPLLLTHPYVAEKLVQRAKIRIENNVWIGAGAIILPGVCVGEAAIIGAGSVVTRDVPPRSIVVGTPARVVRDLA